VKEKWGAEQKKIQIKKKYRSLFELSPAGVYQTTPSGKILACNNTFVKMLGYDSQKELLGENAKLFYFADKDWDDVLNLLQDKGKLENHEIKLKNKKGHPVYMIENCSLQKDNITGEEIIEGVLIDITERKKAEEKYKTILNTTIEGVYLVNLEGKILDTNDSYCKMIGYSRDELLKMSVKNIDVIDTEEVIKNRIQYIMKTGFASFETRHKRKDGRIIDIEASCNFLEDEKEKLFVFMGDITECKKAEALLLKSQQRYKSLLDNMNEGFIVDDISGKLTFANKAFLEIYGLTENDINNFVLEDYVAPEYRQQLRDRHNRRMAGEKVPDIFEYDGLRKDGKRIWLQVRVNPVIENGIIMGTQSLVSDITERKKTEQDLKKSKFDLTEAQRIAHIGSWFLNISEPGKMPGQIIWSEETYKIYGVSPENFIPTAESLLSLIHPDERPLMQNGMNASKKVEKHNEIEFRVVLPDGTLRFLSGRGEMNYDNRNKPLNVRGTVQDITERKIAENTMCESEETFRRLFNESSDPIMILHNAEFTDCNRSTVSIFGYSSRQEILNKKPWDISPEKQPDGWLSAGKAQEIIAIALQQGYNRFEWVHTKSDGTEFPVEVMLTPFILKGKQVVYSILRDITERKAAEIELSQKESYLRTLIKSIPGLLFRVDKHGRFLDFKADEESLLALKPEIFLGKTMYEIWPTEVADFHMGYIKKAPDSNETALYDYSMPDLSGELRFLRQE